MSKNQRCQWLLKHPPDFGTSLIAAVIIAVGTYSLNWWPHIRDFLYMVMDFLGSTTPVWNWLLGLLALVTLGIITLLLAVIFFRGKTETAWDGYRKDQFFGLTWQWKYSTNGSIVDLYSFCRNCSYQVFPKDHSWQSFSPELHYHCDSCSLNVGPINEYSDEVESKVKRFIQQKLRTNNWP